MQLKFDFSNESGDSVITNQQFTTNKVFKNGHGIKENLKP